MRIKLLTLLLGICMCGVILVLEGFSATVNRKPKARHISEDIRCGGSEDDLGLVLPVSKYSAFGTKDEHLACIDSLGTHTNFYDENGPYIRHDQTRHTWYDFQKNGSVGRMISVTSGGYRHFS